MEDVEAFIREHVYAIHVSRMQTGHPLTRLATFEERRQAWRSCSEVAGYLGVGITAIRKATRSGQIAHRRRPGAGRHGEIRIRAEDIPSISEKFC